MFRIPSLIKHCCYCHLLWSDLTNNQTAHHQDQGPQHHKHPHGAHYLIITITILTYFTDFLLARQSARTNCGQYLKKHHIVQLRAGQAAGLGEA